jgi:hypothetical protein
MHLRGLTLTAVLAGLLLVAAPVQAARREEPRDLKTRIIKILKKFVPTILEDGIVPPKP